MNQNVTIQRTEQILVIIGTLAVIYINYLAGTGQINHTTPKEISDKYINLLTPAGYAFAIWSVIYLGLICFSIYQALPSQIQNLSFQKIRTPFLVSCAANIMWLYSWHYDQISPSIVLMLVILSTLIFINRALYLESDSETITQTWLVRIPFGLYFGWITAATILNATVFLIYAGVKLPDSVTVISACGLIAVAVLLAALIRRGLNNIVYALAVAWALVAIAVQQKSETVIFAAALVGAIISILSIFLLRKNTSKLK